MTQADLFDGTAALAVEPEPEPTQARPNDLLALLGDDANPIGWAIQAMGWAEEAIADARDANPDRAAMLERAFIVLRPRSELFRRTDPHVVRSHMDELLRRIASDGAEADVTLGTAAEVCIACMEMGLKAPLKHDYVVVYELAFLDAFGEERARDLLGDESIRRARMDRDQHLKAEGYAELRRHMRDEERGRAWKERIP